MNFEKFTFIYGPLRLKINDLKDSISKSTVERARVKNGRSVMCRSGDDLRKFWPAFAKAVDPAAHVSVLFSFNSQGCCCRRLQSVSCCAAAAISQKKLFLSGLREVLSDIQPRLSLIV